MSVAPEFATKTATVVQGILVQEFLLITPSIGLKCFDTDSDSLLDIS